MQNRYGLSESQRPTLRAAPRREHQAPQMAEAAELDQRVRMLKYSPVASRT